MENPFMGILTNNNKGVKQMFKLIIKYLERKGYVVVKPVSKTRALDTKGTKYCLYKA